MKNNRNHIKCRWFIFALLLFGLNIYGATAEGLDARTLTRQQEPGSETAVKNSSLELIGTAVIPGPYQSVAVIEDLKEKQQWLFHEGERAGGFLIKKIGRDQIIIDGPEGEVKVKIKGLLTAVTKGSKVPEKSQGGPPPTAPDWISPRDRNYVVDHKAAAAALEDPNRALQSVEISSGRIFNRQTGIRIASIVPGSIFTEMGLRSGDLILGVNDQEISGPEDAAYLLQIFSDGGDVDLKVRRRARTLYIHLQIQ